MVPASMDRRQRRSRLLGGGGGVVVSTTSTVLVIGLLVFLIVLAPGSAEVRHTFFSLGDMRRALIGDPQRGIFSVAGGLVINIEMFLIAEVLILVLALVIAVIRQLHAPALLPIRLLALAYTDFFRGVPLILVIYAMGFGLPALNLEVISTQEPVVYGVAALVLSYAAYVSEVYRAGIDSVHPSQAAAARSLGLTEWQALRFVVIPQAVRRVVPPLLNDFISLQKDTALLSTASIAEGLLVAKLWEANLFNLSPIVLVAAFFILITIPQARFVDRLIDRDAAKKAGK